MKKRIYMVLLVAALSVSISACGKKEDDVQMEVLPIEEAEEPIVEEEVVQEEVQDELPAGMVWSELTGLPIDEAIANQKPIAAMVDNDKRAYDHYGLNGADIIYEMMNSTANNRITRLMVIYKDWGNIEQLGSIRSVRPTNFMLAAEYNAVLCHDGGPFYIDAYLAKDYSQNFSGIFSRVSNGKAREFTEYIVKGDLDKAFANGRWSKEYDQYYEGQHFQFAPQAAPIMNDEGQEATNVDLSGGFANTASKLVYDEATGLYTYYAYGNPHKDGKTGEALTFKNLILQKTSYSKLDENGYLVYNVLAPDGEGYYITNGKAVKISWSKMTEKGQTKFTLENGEEIILNKGKTYIGLVPDDHWSEVTLN